MTLNKILLQFSNTSETVLVTGGTGFIGQQLIKALLLNGQRVIVLSRDSQKASNLLGDKIKCIANMKALPSDTKIDVIINLAGARILGWRWTEARKAELRQSRIALTNSLVAWIAQAQVKPRLLLSASAIGYYGIQSENDQASLDENSPPQAIFMSQLCQEWETAASQAAQYGVMVRRMRFGLVLCKQGALPMMLLPIKLGLGGALGRGTQWLSWIHIDDLLAGIAHLWQQSSQSNVNIEQNEAVNFTAPECVTQKQFSQIAASVLHRPCFMLTPAWPIRLALGEQADLLLEGQRVVPNRLLASGIAFTYPHLKQALEDVI
jgi:uncharacterized protein (TIGR01777 family)